MARQRDGRRILGNPVVRELVEGLAGRRTNEALLLLIVAALVTGTLIFALGSGWALAAVVLHGVAGLAIVLLTPWKWRIVRRGMHARSLTSTWPSVALGVLVVVTVATGLLHSSGLVRRYGPLDDMQVHVGSALLLIPVAVWHVFARQDPEPRDTSRRSLLRAGLLIGSSAAVLGGLQGLYQLAGLPGANRRYTGSYEQGSHDPAVMPSIVWLFDPRPRIDADAWRLEVVDHRGVRRLGYERLRGFDDRRTATIDCTSGWYAEQDWHGVALSRLIEVPPDARSVVVRSTTGYFRRLPVDDVPHLLLATGYEGRPLAREHGFPLRLVAPGRRGFWWVKWVSRVEVSDLPWWVQPYFPVQ